MSVICTLIPNETTQAKAAPQLHCSCDACRAGRPWESHGEAYRPANNVVPTLDLIRQYLTLSEQLETLRARIVASGELQKLNDVFKLLGGEA